jgi:hypothetical protein
VEHCPPTIYLVAAGDGRRLAAVCLDGALLPSERHEHPRRSVHHVADHVLGDVVWSVGADEGEEGDGDRGTGMRKCSLRVAANDWIPHHALGFATRRLAANNSPSTTYHPNPRCVLFLSFELRSAQPREFHRVAAGSC